MEKFTVVARKGGGQVVASGGVLRTDAVHIRGVVRQHDRPNALSGTSCQLNAQPANRLAVKAEGIRWDEASSSERRSEEHTSALQSRENLVCRLLLERKNA